MTGAGLRLPQLGPHATGPVVRAATLREGRGSLASGSLGRQQHPRSSSGMRSQPATAVTPACRCRSRTHSALAATKLLTVAAAWTTNVTVGTQRRPVGGYHWLVEAGRAPPSLIDLLSKRVLGGGPVVSAGRPRCIPRWTSTTPPSEAPASRSSATGDVTWPVRVLTPVEDHVGISFDDSALDVEGQAGREEPVSHRSSLVWWGPIGLQRTAWAFRCLEPGGPHARAGSWRAMAWHGCRARPAEHGAARGVVPHLLSSVRLGLSDLRRDAWPRIVQVLASSASGEVIIDANFYEGITSPEAWLDVLDHLTPTLA